MSTRIFLNPVGGVSVPCFVVSSTLMRPRNQVLECWYESALLSSARTCAHHTLCVALPFEDSNGAKCVEVSLSTATTGGVAPELWLTTAAV